jgi:hypothetical protein
MNYYIKRELAEYGPYSLADLQKYMQTGQVAATDLCRSEGMTDWVPVTQVVGNVSVPVAAPAPVFGAVGGANFSRVEAPPNMHWGVVLLISIFTCGLFGNIWLLVLATFIKKVDAESKALIYLVITLVLQWAVPIAASLIPADGSVLIATLPSLSQLTGLVFYFVAIFQMKASLQDHYLNQFGYVKSLSGVMVFFFAPYYFQYHVNETEKVKLQMGASA